MQKTVEDFSLEAPPPPGDNENLGPWVWDLFEDAFAEKERLGLMDRWVSNYRLFRGNHWGQKGRTNPSLVSINLFFANVQRTVANITAKNPVVEVVDMDGMQDNADQLLSTKLRKYWNETEQQSKLATSCQNNEIYGITVEKHSWDNTNKRPTTILVDPYSFFPAPGYVLDEQQLPYIIHAYAMSVDRIAEVYGQNPDDVDGDDVRTILGREDREETRPNETMMERESGIVHGLHKNTSQITSKSATGNEGLVIECWFKDERSPDGIRVVTVTNRGDLVLEDAPNPNLNLEIPIDVSRTCYAWGKYPFSYVNSYDDSTSIWGFSAAEQVAELNKRIDGMVSRLMTWSERVMFPPMIVEKGCGITKSMINNKPGLILRPTKPNARIEFLQVPNPPSAMFQVLEMVNNWFDRVYQIEDADRGVLPTGETAASAIVALQERNSVLIQHKIRAIERMARERGRWAISALQNFSVQEETLEVRGDTYPFKGIALSGRTFNYMVESGSTVARTSMQQQEQAMALYRDGAIDRQALLETLNFPNYKEVIERVGETQLDQALQILVQAGMPEENAMALKNVLMEPQEGNRPQQGQSQGPKPGTPRAQQGGM